MKTQRNAWGAAAVAMTMLLTAGCNARGKKLTEGECELYYKKPVTESEAEGVLDVLEDDGSCDDDRKSFQLRKEGKTYEFRMVVKKGLEDDDNVIAAAKFASARLADKVFDGDKVDVHLCDNTFETLRVVPAQAPSEEPKTTKAGPTYKRIPNSPLELAVPAGWSEKRVDQWGLLRSPDKQAMLAFVTYTRANESTMRLGQVARVLGTSNIKWGPVVRRPLGQGAFPSRIADGTCNFPSGSGVISYATVDPGDPRKALVVYAVADTAPAATRKVALGVVASLRRH